MDIRDLCERDMPAVLALIRADHLLGQPICTLQDVQNAVAGNATIDRGRGQRHLQHLHLQFVLTLSRRTICTLHTETDRSKKLNLITVLHRA